jgi:SAM-dependent methyltransferase
MSYRFSTFGHCPTCEADVLFEATNEWLRDHFLCTRCGSLPRERALMRALELYFPHWNGLSIHESSPEARGASLRLKRGAAGYQSSQYYPGEPPGSIVNGSRNENLARLTLPDASIDLHVTQDVMEHVFHPAAVFREFARTLRPGGAHVFTVPLVRKAQPSRRRALQADGRVRHLVEPPEYHGNPISDLGSLVTIDWGYDIVGHILAASGMNTHILMMDDLSRGIRAEYIEVLISFKPAGPLPPAI